MYNAPIIMGLVDGSVARDQRRIVEVWCTTVTSVTAGSPVAIDPASTVYGQGKSCKVNVIDDNPLCFGVVYASKTADVAGTAVGLILVQVAGSILATDTHNPTAQGTINATEAIGGNNSTTTKTIKAVGTCAATIQPFAVCMTAYTSGQHDGSMMIIDKGWF